MATFRSHFRHAPHQDETPAHTQRKPSSRIPTKSESNLDNKQSKATQHVSRLAKRASRSITPSAQTEDGTKKTEKVYAPVSTARNLPTPFRTASAAPTLEKSSAGILAASTSYTNGAILSPPTMRTPSLVSGSSVSTYDSPRINGLRRKPSTIEKYAASKRVDDPTLETDATTMHSRDDDMKAAFEDSVLGISMPQTATYVHNGAYVATNPKYRLPEDLYYSTQQPVTTSITPPVPNYAQSATPSTRYTDSPFSHVPTPSSASSYSPATVATTSAITPRIRQHSPTRTRPPVTNRPSEKGEPNRLGLPPVREASTSSSNSTIKPSSRSTLPRKELPRKTATAPPSSKAVETQRPSSRGRLVKDKARQPSTSGAKPPVQIPPELAHLAVDPPSKPSLPSLNKALPPIRPSRDGTPTLTGMTNPSPIVQSDLPRLYTTYHKRTPSQETPPVTSPLKTRFGLSPKGSSRQESPRIDSAISPPPASRSFARGPTPDPGLPEGQRLARRDSPAVGPVRSPSKSPRFGFFSRKPKTDNIKPPEKPKREVTKGPAAGTGHEGYGRFGLRGRSGSSSSSTGFRSPSTDSNTSGLAKGASLSGGRKSSVTSKDGADLDDFLRERLNPVVLRGSGSTLSNGGASSSEDPAPSAPGSSKTSSWESYPNRQLLPSAMNSAVGTYPSKPSWTSSRPAPQGRMPSDSSESDVPDQDPTLAARRSLTRLPQPDGYSPMKVPAPINTNRPPKNSSLDSYDAEISAYPNTDSTLPSEDPFEGKEGLWLRSHTAEPEVKAPRKWNFFQRAQASPRIKGKEKAAVGIEQARSIPTQTPYRSVAHYAMLDPLEPVGLEEVERMMQENETSPEDSMSDTNAPPKIVPYDRRHTSLLPSPPRPEYSRDSDFKARPNLPRIMVRQHLSKSPEPLHPQPEIRSRAPQYVDTGRSPIIPEPSADADAFAELPPQVSQTQQNVHTPEMTQRSLNTPDNQPDNSPQRLPRLSPVGRIPQVVSKRDRDRKLSSTSFSRPFARGQARPTVKPPGSLYTQIRELASPIESGSQPVSSTSTRSDGVSGEQKSSVNTNIGSDSTNRTSMDIHANSEFFAFPPRKDSDLSYSGSSGNNSWMAALATLPQQEDDVWHEYNDLLDDVMPEPTPLSTSSSLGAPFQYSSMLYEPYNVSSQGPLYHFPAPQTSLPPPPRSQTVPAVLTVPQQIARFMQPSMSPLTTPQALSEVFEQYGKRSTSTLITPNRTSMSAAKRSSLAQSTRSSIPAQDRDQPVPRVVAGDEISANVEVGSSSARRVENRHASLAQTSRSSLPSARGSVASSRYSRGSVHSRSASLPEANARNSQSSLTPSVRFNRDKQLLDIAEVDGDEQAAVANLRFGALMTSKWLSFGRVLFSPAHNEMRLADDPRILIIDGLGCDWSYYVALSYPGATVYNLGANQANGYSTWPGVNQRPPSNHRHINHGAVSAAFPFPKGFFTAVVLRFPLATTDEAYHACIFECKRVLRPGGYLEVAVLDLDLMNMGNKARKAVRGLKTRMQEKDQNVSLRNLSDVLVRLIGRRGFEEVQRCIVGVPAAGRIPRSQDMSSISSNSSGKPIWHREDGSESQEFSFADLLEDARASPIGPGKNNDENITKMVAKVGRWWYSTCYERTLLQQSNDYARATSIWNYPSLLRECERQGTSFRLLICHAQKPAQTRRRTMSV